MFSRSFAEVSVLFVAAAQAYTAPLAVASQKPLTRAQLVAKRWRLQRQIRYNRPVKGHPGSSSRPFKRIRAT